MKKMNKNKNKTPEHEPVVEKAADSGITEGQDSYKCPGVSSADVVDSAVGAFEVVSSCESSADAEAVSSGDSARISVSVGDRMEIIVSHINDPHSFYMQLVRNQPGFDHMMDSIYDFLFFMSESVELIVNTVHVGDICAAGLFDDGSWNRVRVDSMPGDGTCQIFYIDYGNTEIVDITSLRHLPERFQRISPWAVKAKLGGIAPVDIRWIKEATQEFKKMVKTSGDPDRPRQPPKKWRSPMAYSRVGGDFFLQHLLAHILEVSEDGCECTVHLQCIPVHDELINKGLAMAVDDRLVNKNLQHFYRDGSSYRAGARTSETAGYLTKTHRVPVRRTLGCVSSSLQELKEVSVFVSLEEAGKKVSTVSLEEAGKKVPTVSLEEAGKKVPTVSLEEAGKKVPTVSLEEAGKKVPTVTFEKAGNKQFGSIKLNLNVEYDVIFCGYEKLNYFYIQLLALQNLYLTLISQIEDHVSKTLGNTAVFTPELGGACLVKQSGLWYRGLITSRKSGSWKVKSVDCGWDIIVSCDQMMALPAQLKVLPAQAVCCYLADIVPSYKDDGKIITLSFNWTTDSVRFFLDFVKDTKLRIDVQECSDKGLYSVYLYSTSSSQSVNRVLVELGYAMVLPKTKLKMQMEKSLDPSKDLIHKNPGPEPTGSTKK